MCLITNYLELLSFLFPAPSFFPIFFPFFIFLFEDMGGRGGKGRPRFYHMIWSPRFVNYTFFSKANIQLLFLRYFLKGTKRSNLSNWSNQLQLHKLFACNSKTTESSQSHFWKTKVEWKGKGKSYKNASKSGCAWHPQRYHPKTCLMKSARSI